MTGSALRRWTLYMTLLLAEKFFSLEKGRGSGEGIVAGPAWDRRLSDDGKRLQVLDVA